MEQIGMCYKKACSQMGIVMSVSGSQGSGPDTAVAMGVSSIGDKLLAVPTGLIACISSRITTVIHVERYHQGEHAKSNCQCGQNYDAGDAKELTDVCSIARPRGSTASTQFPS